jgi:CRP-like cAMP-binding protein
MSFRLKEAMFKVRCREPGCPFFSEFVVKENIMGATEADIDTEALKIARNLGYIKHDALFGRKHPLASPDVTKVSGSYERIGVAPAAPAPSQRATSGPSAPSRTYRRGEAIISKGESAATVCEVLQGTAYNIKHPDMPYKTGSTFGAAALFRHKSRMADIVAGEDGTTVAFYDLRELSKSNPSKARELYDEAMEDVFHIITHLEEYASGLERRVKKLEAENLALKARPTKKAAPAKKKSAAKKKPAPRKQPAPKKAKKR